MITVAIANQKGGVGKTSTTINLAGALARLNKTVLLIDLDPQGSLTEYFFSLTDLPYTVYNTIIDKTPIQTLKLGDSISLLAANIDLAAAEMILPTMSNSDKRLSIELKKYASFDYCLIDCPPTLGNLTKNALTAANLIIVPVSTDLVSLRTIRLIMNTVNDVRESELNPDLKVWRILPTKHTLKGKESSHVLSDLMGTYKDLVYPEPVMERENYKKAVRSQVDVADIDTKLGEYWDKMASTLVNESEVQS